MIDTEKLDKLQRYSRTVAALGLAIFFALIVISLWSFWRVRKEIADLEQKRLELAQEVKELDAKRQELEAQNAALLPAAVKQQLQAMEPQNMEPQNAALSQTISEIAQQRPESVKKAINQVTAEQPDKPTTGQENKRVEYTKQAIDQLIQAAPSVAKNLTRIYLHIGDESQRPRARRIAGQLRQAGYLVPGIENVGERGMRNPTQVSYYARTDAEKDEAQKIIGLLQGWGIKAQNRPITVTSRPWQYEIWFGSDFN